MTRPRPSVLASLERCCFQKNAFRGCYRFLRNSLVCRLMEPRIVTLNKSQTHCLQIGSLWLHEKPSCDRHQPFTRHFGPIRSRRFHRPALERSSGAWPALAVQRGPTLARAFVGAADTSAFAQSAHGDVRILNAFRFHLGVMGLRRINEAILQPLIQTAALWENATALIDATDLPAACSGFKKKHRHLHGPTRGTGWAHAQDRPKPLVRRLQKAQLPVVVA